MDRARFDSRLHRGR